MGNGEEKIQRFNIINLEKILTYLMGQTICQIEQFSEAIKFGTNLK